LAKAAKCWAKALGDWEPRQLKQYRDARSVVVGTGAFFNRVVVRADDEDLAGRARE
jgi:hypothetical protein